MILRFSICPSFSEGFAVEVIEQPTVHAIPAASPNAAFLSSYVIKTKRLADGARISAAQLENLFFPLRNSQTLSPEDAAPLCALVRGVHVGIPPQSSVALDGSPSSLSIQSGDLLLALEWNAEPPPEWQGIPELVAHMASLYPLYRHQRGQ